MSKSTYTIKIRVYVQEMVAFYKENQNYGTKDKPYPAGSFYELVSPYATFYGPLRNILVLQDNCIYQWVLEADDGTPLKFSSTSDDAQLDMEMITSSPSDEKWKKVFPDAPEMESDGKIKVKNTKPDKDVFELESGSDISGGGKIKYSFLFEFEDEDGETKYGLIDPVADVEMPPPPPPTT